MTENKLIWTTLYFQAANTEKEREPPAFLKQQQPKHAKSIIHISPTISIFLQNTSFTKAKGNINQTGGKDGNSHMPQCAHAQTCMRTKYHSAVKLAAFSWYLWWLAERNSSSNQPPRTLKDVVSQLPGKPLVQTQEQNQPEESSIPNSHIRGNNNRSSNSLSYHV